ncbi:MAG: sugar ABC transporter substrate-binding protein [Ruminiclostridium sp.]
MKTNKLMGLRAISFLTVAIVAISSVGCGSQNAKTSETSSTQSSSSAVVSQSSTSTNQAAAEDFAAKAELVKVANPSTYKGPTEPAKAPANIKMAIIPASSTLEGCVAPGRAVEEASKALGWETQWYDGKGSPADQNKAIINAVTWGANVISCISLDPRAVQQGLKAAKDKNVLVVSGSNGIDDPNPTLSLSADQLNFAFDVAPNYYELGVAVADWIINDSNNQGNIVIYGDKEFPSIEATQIGLLEELKKSNLKLEPVQYFTANQIGKVLDTEVVGYLRSHPEVNYVYAGFDPPAASMVPAIAQAGFASRVKLVSAIGNQQNLDFIRKGNVQVADAAYDNRYMGYAMVDQTIRLLNNMSLITPHNENLPFQILDKTNLIEQGKNWTASYYDLDTFLKLWK